MSSQLIADTIFPTVTLIAGTVPDPADTDTSAQNDLNMASNAFSSNFALTTSLFIVTIALLMTL